MEESPHKNQEYHIAGEGLNFLSHCNPVHKFIPMLQAMKMPDAKEAVEKEWEKLETIQAWQLTKGRNKNEVIAEARNEGRKIPFASSMYLCHLKKSDMEPQFQKYKGQVELRGDIVKDDAGSYAVCTEQGSPAAKVMDILTRLPRCAGQAADAISAYDRVKMEDAPSLFKIPKSKCPDIWIHLPKHNWPKSRSSTEDPVVPLERNLYGHPLRKRLFSSVYVDDIKIAAKKQHISPTWKNTNEKR